LPNKGAFLKTLKKLNREEPGRLAEIQKTKKRTVDKRKGTQTGQAWEFENYIKERLRALGIIQ